MKAESPKTVCSFGATTMRTRMAASRTRMRITTHRTRTRMSGRAWTTYQSVLRYRRRVGNAVTEGDAPRSWSEKSKWWVEFGRSFMDSKKSDPIKEGYAQRGQYHTGNHRIRQYVRFLQPSASGHRPQDVP